MAIEMTVFCTGCTNELEAHVEKDNLGNLQLFVASCQSCVDDEVDTKVHDTLRDIRTSFLRKVSDEFENHVNERGI